MDLKRKNERAVWAENRSECTVNNIGYLTKDLLSLILFQSNMFFHHPNILYNSRDADSILSS